MTISPGRVGELIKPLMLKQFFGVRVRRGVPLVFCERLTDLFGMNLLTILTFTPFALKMASQRGDASVAEKFGMGAIMIFFIAQLVFMVLVVALVRRRKFVGGILLRLRHPRLRKAAKGLLHMYLSCYDLLTLARLGKATLIASASWFFECVAGWLICLGLGLATPESLFSVSAPGVSLWDVTFIFCIASIAGGLSTLPGGLGGFELVTDQLLKMLLFGGVMAATLFPDPESAYGAIGAFMVILRAFTLFYAVLLGFAFIGITTRAYHHAIDWTEIERSRQAH
jgi:uncharacterized membrane protein YbhN (UPF0104 family)